MVNAMISQSAGLTFPTSDVSPRRQAVLFLEEAPLQESCHKIDPNLNICIYVCTYLYYISISLCIYVYIIIQLYILYNPQV